MRSRPILGGVAEGGRLWDSPGSPLLPASRIPVGGQQSCRPRSSQSWSLSSHSMDSPSHLPRSEVMVPPQRGEGRLRAPCREPEGAIRRGPGGRPLTQSGLAPSPQQPSQGTSPLPRATHSGNWPLTHGDLPRSRPALSQICRRQTAVSKNNPGTQQ